MLSNSIVSAVGIWFFCIKTRRHLYLMRNDKKYNEQWALPGGKIEIGESLMEAIERECVEEMSFMPDYIKIIPVEKFTADGNYFSYHTFFCLVQEEFVPVLNHEHIGYAWIDSGTVPKPLHPGFWNTLKDESIYNKIDTLTALYT